VTVELWWLGQSGFRVRDPDNGLTIFLDPFLTPSDRRSWQAPAGPADLAAADVVLASHEHTDHLDLPTLRAAAVESGSRFTLVVPEPLVERVIAETGLPNGRVLGTQPGATIERSGLHIDPVPARHGVNVSDSYTFGEQLSKGLVRYLGYVVETGGVRLYHAGDCIPYAGQIERLRELHPQLALLPINGRDFYRESERNLVGNMDPREAARIANDIGASVLIPMHWELFDHNRGFPRDLVAFSAQRYPELSVLIFGRGARHAFVAQQ
jgi:L-ascorbate 6-phosphate lactonase